MKLGLMRGQSTAGLATGGIRQPTIAGGTGVGVGVGVGAAAVGRDGESQLMSDDETRTAAATTDTARENPRM
jgi:hypothetical protein